MPVTIKTGAVKYKDPATGQYVDIDAAGGDISDVQVAGTSVVNNGVASVPVASDSALGVVAVGGGSPITIQAGRLALNTANSSRIKRGSDNAYPIAPNKQNESVFFGLSKAAGVDLADENVTVGTYPDTSKAAINTMIGSMLQSLIVPEYSADIFPIAESKFCIYNGELYVSKQNILTSEPWTAEHWTKWESLSSAVGLNLLNVSTLQQSMQYIALNYYQKPSGGIPYSDLAEEVQVGVTFVETITGTTPSVVCEPNVRYVCGEVSTISITPCTQGTSTVRFSSGSTPAVLTIPNTVKFPDWVDVSS